MSFFLKDVEMTHDYNSLIYYFNDFLMTRDYNNYYKQVLKYLNISPPFFLYPIFMDSDMKFKKIYQKNNIFEYFIDI